MMDAEGNITIRICAKEVPNPNSADPGDLGILINFQRNPWRRPGHDTIRKKLRPFPFAKSGKQRSEIDA
jgi:hypothetical protein